uniref:Beta-galactosidase trimerisation domain-containing protein n=1 Tax=Solibacter usitatus (strain Ellin6076) TaxID=234267 RepID=Q027I9_SOLUE
MLAVSAASAVPGNRDLPFRQVHLDFHNGELIPDIGAEFDVREFVAVLKKARVNSVNIFAKCMHGYAYYQTKIGVPHPSLKIDLLGEMLKELRPAGMAANYYYGLTWDALAAERHPEWRILARDGSPVIFGGHNSGVEWRQVCLNSPYLDQVARENEEILTRYRADGAWFDIAWTPPDGCFCRWCRAERERTGLGDSAPDIKRHNKMVALRMEARLTELVHRHWPEALVFYNSRTVLGIRDELANYSHIEIESLPTGGWGYTHLQQRVRHMRTLGKQLVGMNGRFHKSWGDFGGLKNQAALDYECLSFLSNGTRCCVGDQLHPRGRLDAATYARIGATYAKVEALEPYVRGARVLADIGVVSAAVNTVETTSGIPLVDAGFTNMLVELHQQFDILDLESRFEDYRLLILPDDIHPVPGLVAALRRYLAGGGALIASHRSLFDPGTRDFALPELGVKFLGESRYRDEYFYPAPGAFPDLPDYAYFLYQRGLSIAALPGAEVLATYGHPYFDRSPEHYSSHVQTPVDRPTTEPLVVALGRTAYIANPLFRSYAADGYGVYKQMVGALIRRLLPSPVLRTANLPSTAQVTVMEQDGPAGKRRVVHLLYYPLTRRAPNLDVIEEPGLLQNVHLQLRTPAPPRAARLAPAGTDLPVRYANGYAALTVPFVTGYQAIMIEL